MEQHIATYHFPSEADVEVYGVIYDDTPKNSFESYDLWVELNNVRVCINEGYYIFNWPTWSKVKELLEEYQAEEAV